MTLPILPFCTGAPGRRGGGSNYGPPSNTHTLWQSCRRAWTKLSLLYRRAPPAPFLLSPGVNRQPWPFIQAIMVCDRSHSSLALSCPAWDALFSVRIYGMPLAGVAGKKRQSSVDMHRFSDRWRHRNYFICICNMQSVYSATALSSRTDI